MRPKANVVVVGIRPELRFILRIAGRVNVSPVETMPELERRLAEDRRIDLFIIDMRDAPKLAANAVRVIRKYFHFTKTILIAGREVEDNEPVCDDTLREGTNFSMLLFQSVKLGTARKRGPMKGQVSA